MTPRQKLAAIFNLPYDDRMQDWELEVSDASRLPEFIETYKTNSDLSDAEKFELVRLILASYEDLLGLDSTSRAGLQTAVEDEMMEVLLQDYTLHTETIDYWSKDYDGDNFLPRAFLLRVKEERAKRAT